ncbi:hypothetical protein K504DRAFT_391117, partial [Pleomassaria siparia CBS 279.74]
IFKLDNIKGLFFLTTLPNTIDNIINNLSIRNITLFTSIKLKILNILEKHSLDTVNLLAYAARLTTCG